MRDSGGHWRIEDPLPGKMVEPGLVMYWFGADLFYANAALFATQALQLVHDSPTLVRWLVVDGTAITNIDFSAGRVMAELQRDLNKAGVTLALIVVQVRHQGKLENMGLVDLIGRDRIFESRQECLAAYERAHAGSDKSR